MQEIIEGIREAVRRRARPIKLPLFFYTITYYMLNFYYTRAHE